jgi:hypothetical protein
VISVKYECGRQDMQEEYTGTLLTDGHISIPREIVEKLKIDIGSKLRVTVSVERCVSKNAILSYAGLLSDLTEEEEKRFDENVKRRSFFQNRQAQI